MPESVPSRDAAARPAGRGSAQLPAVTGTPAVPSFVPAQKLWPRAPPPGSRDAPRTALPAPWVGLLRGIRAQAPKHVRGVTALPGTAPSRFGP